MTKKHFIALAAAIKHSKPFTPENLNATDYTAALAQWETDAKALVGVCASFNGNFDRSRFMSACGLE